MPLRLAPPDVAGLAQAACLLEATVPKPGNVSPGRPFRDMTFEDFAASAGAVAPVLGRAADQSLGTTIREAIWATRAVTPANTNLGIVLLLAPLARASLTGSGPLRERLHRILATTTVADARDVYAAIRAARPGGLGASPEQDLQRDPTVSLTEAMRLAAGRDSIAREYITDFAITFEIGLPAVRDARAAGLDWDETTIEAYLAILSAVPDTLIGRKLGAAPAAAISARATRVRAAGGVRSPEGRAALAAFDADLRDPQNSRNPGTSADLTAAALYAALLENYRTTEGATS